MVRIITDSATDIPPRYILEHNIQIVPVRIWFGTEDYLAGETLSSNDFYRFMKDKDVHPKTVPPSPYAFHKAMSRYNEPTLVITIGSGLSKIYDNAIKVKNRFKMMNHYVYDTHSVTMGAGWQVIYAAKLAQVGYSIPEIIEKLDVYRERTRVYATTPTLRYLLAGGRINRTRYLSGSLFNIKPILTISDNEIKSEARALGYTKAIETMIETVQENYPLGVAMNVCVLHANNPQLAELIGRKVRELYDVSEYVSSFIGPSVGSHIGPGSVGIAISPAFEI